MPHNVPAPFDLGVRFALLLLDPWVGTSCNIDLLIDDIREELRAGLTTWSPSPAARSTRPAYADALRSAFGTAVGGNERATELTQSEVLMLMCTAYFQPITRAELSSFFGKEIARDLIGNLRGAGLIASGPRNPTPGAPYPTTKEFLLEFGLDTLRDLPDFEALEDAGLLSKEKLLAGDIPIGLVARPEDEDDRPVAARCMDDRTVDPRLSWKDVTWIKERWGGKLILKGILDAEDVRIEHARREVGPAVAIGSQSAKTSPCPQDDHGQPQHAGSDRPRQSRISLKKDQVNSAFRYRKSAFQKSELRTSQSQNPVRIHQKVRHFKG